MKIIREFNKRFLKKIGNGYACVVANPKEVEEFLIQAFNEARLEGEKYKGKVKREAYQLGYEEGKGKMIEKIERLVRDIAHRNNLKVGTSAFGLHYEICSELSKLKSNKLDPNTNKNVK